MTSNLTHGLEVRSGLKRNLLGSVMHDQYQQPAVRGEMRIERFHCAEAGGEDLQAELHPLLVLSPQALGAALGALKREQDLRANHESQE